MYRQFWRLKDKPFENTPDPKFLYHSPQHEEGPDSAQVRGATGTQRSDATSSYGVIRYWTTMRLEEGFGLRI